MAALAAIAVVGLSSGCSGSSAKGSASSAAKPAAGGSGGGLSGDVAPNQAAPSAGSPAGSGQKSLAKAPVAGRSLVYTATLTVHTKDVASATANAENLAASNGGFVGTENSQSGTAPDSQGLTQSTVTLRVPSTAFDKVIDQLGTGGSVQNETRSASDVTTQVVDTNTRISAQQASIARITELMKSATNLSDVVSLEGELSHREADLESMQAQQASLSDQVSLSTITVTFLTPTAPATTPVAEHQNALQRGLHNGWAAFLGTAKVLLIIVGALLPFAILAAILWWPVTRLIRVTATLRRRMASALAPSPPPSRWQSPGMPTPAPVLTPTPAAKEDTTDSAN